MKVKAAVQPAEMRKPVSTPAFDLAATSSLGFDTQISIYVTADTQHVATIPTFGKCRRITMCPCARQLWDLAEI